MQKGITFKEWLFKRRHLTSGTVDLYDRWASLYRKEHGDHVTEKSARRWLVSIASNRKIPLHAVTALKHFCVYLITTGKQPDAPYSSIKKPKSHSRHIKPASYDVIARHIKAQGDTPAYIQGRAAILLIYSSLVKPLDALSMSWNDIDFYSGSITANGLWHPIHKTALDALADWHRLAPVLGPFTPVFSHGGVAMSSSSFANIVRRVDKSLTPYSVRESAIRAMLLNGASVVAVAQLSGLDVSSIIRRIGITIPLDKLRSTYMHAHPHAEIREKE